MINQLKEQKNEKFENCGNVPDNYMNSDPDSIPKPNEQQERPSPVIKRNEVLLSISYEI